MLAEPWSKAPISPLHLSSTLGREVGHLEEARGKTRWAGKTSLMTSLPAMSPAFLKTEIYKGCARPTFLRHGGST